MKKLLLLFIIHYSFYTIHSAEPVPYRLVNSDNLSVHRTQTEYVTNLVGNVHFFYDDIEFLADIAEIYEQQNYVTLRGNVKAIQDTLHIACDTAEYYHHNKHLRASGNVVMSEIHEEVLRRRTIANIATHYRDKGEFILFGDVFAHDVQDSLYASAGYAFYDSQAGYSYMIQNPLVWRTGADSLSLSAQKIEFYEQNSKVVASFGVVTQNKDIKATSNFLIYYGDEEKLVYIGEPKFFSADGDGYADLITVFLEGQSVREIWLEENSYINFRTDENAPKDSWINSKDMILYYSDDKPREFVATENVQSFFRRSGSTKNQEMNNNVQGERLVILFDEKSNVSDLQLFEGIRGKYRFERKRRSR